MEQSSSWKANSNSDSQETPRLFLEPECSLTYSQQPATVPYPETDESTPQHPTYFLSSIPTKVTERCMRYIRLS